MLRGEAINKDILKRTMKDKIKSLLGIEMSLGQRQFKPFLLLLGILFFFILLIPLSLLYGFLYAKFSLLNLAKDIHKEYKRYYKK